MVWLMEMMNNIPCVKEFSKAVAQVQSDCYPETGKDSSRLSKSYRRIS